RFFYYCYDPPVLHSFPTRRSSDLPAYSSSNASSNMEAQPSSPPRDWEPTIASTNSSPSSAAGTNALRASSGQLAAFDNRVSTSRSEEHTSELQSRENLVCRLLLEK